MAIISIILQILLGIFFTPEGVIKWTRIGPSTARFEHFRYPRWFKYFTGGCELLIGIGFLAGLWLPLLATLASALLSIEMVIAIYSHIVRGKDRLGEILPAVVFLILAFVVLAIHWESLRAFLSLL
jgi:putative oxidoreductase